MTIGRGKWRRGFLILTVATAVACSGAPGQTDATAADPAPPPGASGWAGDVDALVGALEATHPEPYHSISREDFATAVLGYKQQLPQMSEWEAVVGFQRLLGLLTSKGRDGHMLLRPADRTSHEWRMFPIQLYWFADGIHVVASKDDPRLVGAELIRVGATPIDDAIQTLKPLVTKDNAMTVRSRVPAYLETPDLLTALGLMDASSQTLTFSQDGVEVTPDFETIGVDEHADWLGLMHPYARRLPPHGGAMYLLNQDDSIWVRYLRASDSIYIAFNLVHPPFDQVISEIDLILDSKPVERVVLDLRHNPGGETGLYGPLLQALKDPRINRPGRLFALTGRVTFSAAANFMADLDNDTCVVITGEPPGAAPRFWNDNDALTLPYSGLVVAVATRWWGKGGKRHPGTLFEVDLPARYRSVDYLAGKDPVLRKAVEHAGRECP